MTFISFAQNFEDVILWRALNSFGPGFYIDVGACDSTVDSVTKAFYDAGWRGINVEPMKEAYDRICKDRVRDINLNIAVDAHNGIKKFYSIDNGNGLSTSVKDYADEYISDGKSVNTIDIETQTLAHICKTFVNEEIKFLKIDVEGSEQSVLEGADFVHYRPWIVLVESTKPNTTIMSHHSWEPILLTANYTFVYFDGLNRFYVANEKLELLQCYFNAPPNWFDHFELNSAKVIAEELKNIKQEIDDFVEIIFDKSMKNENEVALLKNSLAGESAIELMKSIVETIIFERNSFKEKNDLELDAYVQELYENGKQIGFLAKERNEMSITINSLKQQLSELQQVNAALEQHRTALLQSHSWRITKPIRAIFGKKK